jgi:mannose-1-phosphate guanylyltransferase
MAFNNGSSALKFAPVILAGGSGTRFWPRSRKALAKQVLALDGGRTLIQQTLERLLPLANAPDIWVITNDLLEKVIADQLPELQQACILSEPAARNTAPACALAAFLLEKSEPDTVIGIFPSDQVVKNRERFVELIQDRGSTRGDGKQDRCPWSASNSGRDGLWIY